MSIKNRMLMPVLCMTGFLTACTTPLPQPNPNDAWVGLQEEPQNSMLADQLDGTRLKDGRFFEVKPGSHKLEVLVYKESNPQLDEQICRGSIDFATFKAGRHYTLVETSLGETMMRASLKNENGKTLASTDQFDCMSG